MGAAIRATIPRAADGRKSARIGRQIEGRAARPTRQAEPLDRKRGYMTSNVGVWRKAPEAGEWAIYFSFPEGGVYAGWTRDNALGFAPTIATAARFETREAAARTLLNGYGNEIVSFGQIVRAPDAN